MPRKKMVYPVWKLLVWRYLRVFLSAFLVVLAVSLSDVNNVDNLWELALYPAIIAGISALGKYLRETLGNGDYTKKIYKLPL